jgi:hypothetical protein
MATDDSQQTTEQRSAAHFDGIDIELTTRGPEAQDGHEIGSDVLHQELKRAMSDVLEGHDE